jgi:hypothetical protein
MLEDSFENEDKAILQSLETLQFAVLCVSPFAVPLLPLNSHILSDTSAVSDREYDLQLECILPFMRLNNIRPVHTLAAHTFNDINALPPDMQPYMKSSRP